MTIIGKIEWNDAQMSVNISKIDKQHRALVNLINNLFDAVKDGKGNAIFEKLISDLITYGTLHFDTEERYFDQFKYPDANNHKQLHKMFVDKISDFQNDFNRGKTGLSVGVMYFLKEWLIDHIMLEDKKYTNFFNDKGLK